MTRFDLEVWQRRTRKLQQQVETQIVQPLRGSRYEHLADDVSHVLNDLAAEVEGDLREFSEDELA
jgi:hypothetical protein